MTDKTLGKARGLNSIADPAQFRGTAGRKRQRTVEPEPETEPERPMLREVRASKPLTEPTSTSTPTSARRKRRELSVPHDVAEALTSTAINPADIVMSAYRRHGDAIYAGAGGRPISRGRSRLRLSLNDMDFDKIVRLGDVRGWNRSETVAVLISFELLPETMQTLPKQTTD